MILGAARRTAIPIAKAVSAKRLISVKVRHAQHHDVVVKLSFTNCYLLQSILHGSPEAKEVGDLEVQQHSRLVARGKYLHGFECESQ